MINKNVYIETYGCQMNLSDTEIVSSVLIQNGFSIVNKASSADVILLNTCSVRENAERKIFERLTHLKQYRKKNHHLIVGIIGCMAERMKDRLVGENDMVNLTAGPDEYRNIHELIKQISQEETTSFDKLRVALDEKFFLDKKILETYDDIAPLRTDGVSAWVSIMRGCNNFCSYCVVPYTRGRERSRPLKSIVAEVSDLMKKGYREVTLLGQNVNSYKCPETNSDFPDLLSAVAIVAPAIRFRFMTSHPKDISDKLIETIGRHENICNHIHLAMQSGSNSVLKNMNRKYSIEHFLGRIEKIKSVIPDCSLTTDIIAGFPGETLEDHHATMKAMEIIKYDTAFMFRYSSREGTKAFELNDDVAEEEKIRRLNEIIHLQQKISKSQNSLEVGRIHKVLIEGRSKKSESEWFGRTDTNKVVIFPYKEAMSQGDYIKVKITGFTSATLFGEIV
ncbi:tRNA (N6-isopentenyl adenosine(37)-C2)-methylthiotransferase MiaB [Bacteroidetes/Chlorobi group bacterium ChocPot_Mid]|nr:MAG: tRNA (N6-isopentenyl adenosine(37)-C2)-methylthiotransferase MiaB [Bacteroidetes/Chlorobi group bacterium ChocPot_Mid]